MKTSGLILMLLNLCYLPPALAQYEAERLMAIERNFAIVDSAVFFIEKYEKVALNYVLTTDLVARKYNFATLIEQMKINNQCRSEEKINGFIRCHVLIQLRQLSSFPYESKNDLKELYHHTLKLFNYDSKDFDEGLLNIYQLHRAHVRTLIRSKAQEEKINESLNQLTAATRLLEATTAQHMKITASGFQDTRTWLKALTDSLSGARKEAESRYLANLMFRNARKRYAISSLSHEEIIREVAGNKYQDAKRNLRRKLREK